MQNGWSFAKDRGARAVSASLLLTWPRATNNAGLPFFSFKARLGLYKATSRKVLADSTNGPCNFQSLLLNHVGILYLLSGLQEAED